MEILEVNENSFEEEVLQADIPVLVDCFTGWCAPCKQQLPILKQFAADNPYVKIVKIDVDNAPNISSKYGIRSVPTLLLFNQGQKVNSKVGLTNARDLQNLISSI